jgi:hypothetical protein
MNASVVRIILALILAVGVLAYLFHGSVASMQPPPAQVHSTLPSGQAK